MSAFGPWPGRGRWRNFWFGALLLGACSAGRQPGETTPEEETLGQPPRAEAYAPESAQAEEEAGPPDGLEGRVELGANLPCRPIRVTEALQEDLAHFNRWLRDQSVGRQVTVEELGPVCQGRRTAVVNLILAGPAGGLQSMGRALQAYYPRSEWKIRQYERLRGARVPLRVLVEVTLHPGDRPRPRCQWDPAQTCP